MVPLMELIAGEIAGKVHHLLHLSHLLHLLVSVFSESVEWNMQTAMQISITHSPALVLRFSVAPCIPYINIR